MRAAAGIDVAGDRLHAVVIDEERRVLEARVWSPADSSALAAWLAAFGVERVAIDAPDAASTAPHREDATLSPKFRVARCGEIELGRRHRIWVSWVTPAESPFPAWMAAGFALFDAVRSQGIDAIEVFPHAAYRLLAGRRLASKLRPDGIAARVAAVRAAGVEVPYLEMWSHDGLDALAAALVAADAQAVGVTCGHDGSAIWVPAMTRDEPATKGIDA